MEVSLENSSQLSQVESEDDEDYLYNKETDESTPLASRRSKNCCGITPWLFITTSVCIYGSSFQFGYNIAVVNTPEKVIRHYFTSRNVTMTDFIWSAAVSITPIGGLIGAMVGPVLADMFGRKSTLLWNNVIVIIGCIFVFLSHTVTSTGLLIIGRFIIGINNGIDTVVVPMFLSEISPTHLRGAVGTLNQFGIVFGMLVANILGLHQVLGTSTGWPYVMSFSVVPAVIQFIILPCCPSSPRYLLIKLNKESLARQELRKLQGTYNLEQVINEMKVEKVKESKEGTITILQLLKTKSLRFPLFLSVLLQISQQFSGINSVMYYSTSTFRRAGISDPDVATCGTSIVSILMVGISVFLVERLGRRTLMLTGLAGMFFSYGLITIGYALEDEHDDLKYVAVVCTFLVLSFFQIGPGPIPWFMMAELFSQGPRPAATSIAGSANWLSSFIIAITFPSIQDALFPYVFIVYMVFIIILWALIYVFVPETKGKTFEQISRELRRKLKHSINNEHNDIDEN
ncbi:solute carrier family 2, facilitated glucose transporter member 1-like [Paramuricea clavata]|uniref:Solute carrier family 2, facilitated glucose transporter member 1-like n=1 Tax=Paramuricea clavata TaxID=317549 RepID=A0A7D9IE50_PARCT|nr:solute carrier family 2, facilitated glucose transporter member 1-like [Paramuricea clavata]